MTLNADQQAVRKTGIGASEIGAIVGAAGSYDSALAIWARKVGLVEDADETESPEHVELGNLLEPVIASLYTRRTGRELVECGTLIHPTDPLRIATPDRLVVGERRGVQIKKARSKGSWGQEGTDDVPENIVAQVQWEMSVADLDVEDVPVLFWGSHLSIYTVKRDDELIGNLAQIATKWWRDHVIAQHPPDPDGSDRARETIAKIFPRSSGRWGVPSPEVSTALLAHALDYEAARAAEAEAKERKDAAGNMLRLILGDAEGIAAPWGKVSFKSDASGRPSWKEVAEALKAPPELVAQHTRPPTRTLRVNLRKTGT